MTRTLMVRLPRLFQTRSEFPTKTLLAADTIVFVITSGDFLFYIDNGLLFVLNRIDSSRRFK